MAKKSIIPTYQLDNTDDESVWTLDQDRTSITTRIDQQDKISYQLAWDAGASPDGEVFVDVSLDKETWQALDFGSPITIDATDTNHFIDVVQTGAVWIRLRFAWTSGTSTMTVKIAGASIGG